MKAVVLEAKGQALVIREIDAPLLVKGMVELRIKAAALNHRDLWITKGLYAGIKYPMVLGSDGSGVVERVGKEVSEDWIGKEVLINPSMFWGEEEGFQGSDFKILGLPDFGTLAETLIIPAEYLHPMPSHLTFAQAAALPLAGLTAYRALFGRAKVGAAEKILITGAGGGVAQFALQFAVAIGCEVWVTSGNPQKIKLAKGNGAKGGVNYKDSDWASQLREKAGVFDVIIDGAAGEGFASLLDLAAPGCRIVVYGGTNGNIEKISPQKLFWKQISILGSTMGSPNDFHNMLRFVEMHQIVPVIDEVFPFENVQDAFVKMDEGSQIGKLVIEM